MKSPKNQKTSNWTEAKCKKCHSMSLDYGKAEEDTDDTDNGESPT